MQNRFINKIYKSGMTGVKNTAFGYATSSALGLTATKTLSLGLALSSGAVGAALFLAPAIALRYIAKNNLGLGSQGMFALDLALALAGAAIGAYCFGLTMVSMVTCMAVGLAVTIVVDWLGDAVYRVLDIYTSAPNDEEYSSDYHERPRGPTLARSLFGSQHDPYFHNALESIDGLSYPVGYRR